MSPANAYRVIDLVNNLEQNYLSHEDEAVRVLAILQTQPVFRDVLGRYQRDIVRAYTAPYPDGELTRVIKTIFSEIREAPHLYERDIVQKEEAQIIEEAAGRAKELKAAEETVKTTVQKIKIQRAGVNRVFVKRVVEEYTRNLIKEERTLAAKEISGKVVNALENDPTITAGQAVKTTLLESFPDIDPNTVDRAAGDVRFKELEQSYGETIETVVGSPVVFSEKPEATAHIIDEIIDKSSPASTPGELVSITRDAGEIAGPVAKAVEAGTRFENLPENERNRVLEEASKSFLTTIGDRKTTAAITETFTTVFGRDPVNEALGNIFAKNTAAVEANPQALSGKAFPLGMLKKSIETATAGETKPPSPALRRVPSFMVRASQAAVNPFFKKNSQAFQIVVWYAAITGKQFQEEMVPFLLDAAKSPWKNILSFGAKTAAKKGTEIAVQKAAKTGMGKLLSALFGTLIAGPAGTIAGFIGHKILEPLISVGLKLFGGAFSSLWNGVSGQITDFSNQPPGKYSWARDMAIVLPLLIVAFVGIPALAPNLFPSFGFSNSLFQKQGQDGWQIVMISKGEAGGGGAEVESGDTLDLQNNPQARAQKILSQKRSSQILSLTVPPPIRTCSQTSGGVCVEFTAGSAGEVKDSCGSGASSSNWTDSEWQMVQQTINDLNKSPSFMGYVNDGNPISIYRTRTDFGGGCFIHGSEKSSIVLYNGAFSSPNLLRYTLAHELGHAISYSSPELYNSFYSSGIMQTEGYLPSYPNKKRETEDFAETLGLYTFYKNSRSYTDYPSAFPNHYNFAEKVFSGTVY